MTVTRIPNIVRVANSSDKKPVQPSRKAVPVRQVTVSVDPKKHLKLVK
jgi:hypothetical protein